MKRLLEQIGLAFLSVLAIVFYFGKTSALVICVISLVAFAVFLVVQKFRDTIYLPAIALVAFIACTMNIAYTTMVYDKIIDACDERQAVVTARLKDEPDKLYDCYSYKFNAIKADSVECDFDFIVYHKELLDMSVGDKITIATSFYKNENDHNKAEGYYLIGDFGYNLPNYSITRCEDDTIYYKIIRFRQTVRGYIDEAFDDRTASLCKALLIGDKHALSTEDSNDFIISGVSHLIVVSGMHFSILASVFLLFAKKVRKLRGLSVALVFLFVIFYTIFTGATGSVLRSAIMMIVLSVGVLIARDVYGPNSLGLAAIIVVFIFGPYCAGDVGLLLSFASTYSILKLSPFIYEKLSGFLTFSKKEYKNKGSEKLNTLLRKLKRSTVSLISMNISAYAVSVPLSIIFFDAFSTVSVITSFLLALPVQIILLSLLAFAVISFIPVLSLLQPVVVFVINVLSDITFDVVTFFSDLNFSYVYVENNYVYLCIGLISLISLLVVLSKSRYRIQILAVSMVLMLAAGSVSAYIISKDYAYLNIYDVGNGSCVVYTSQTSDVLLDFECSDSKCYSAINKIKKSTTQLWYYSCVKDTQQAFNCLVASEQAFAIENVLLYDSKRSIDLSDTKVYTPTDVYTANLSDKQYVEYYKLNDQYVTFFNSGTNTVLILPDAFDAALLPQKLLKPDILIVSSGISNYQRLSCDTLVISVGEQYADNLMDYMYSISNRVLLTKDSDIKLQLEV